MRRIAIIKTSALGDIVQAFQALRQIKPQLSDVEITWVIEENSLEILQGEPEVDYLIPVQMKGLLRKPFSLLSNLKAISQRCREKEYDCVIDLQGNIKSLLLLNRMRSARKVGFGYRTAPEKINLLGTNVRLNPPKGRSIREDYLFLLGEALGIDSLVWKENRPRNQQNNRVLICPFSIWPNKELSEEALLYFVKRNQAAGKEVSILSVTPREIALAEQWAHLTGAKIFAPASLVKYKVGIGDFGHVIAVDSFPLHMADMQGVETFSIFGASSAKKYAPIQAHSFQGQCPYGIRFEKRCPYLRSCKTGACIKRIDFGKMDLQC